MDITNYTYEKHLSKIYNSSDVSNAVNLEESLLQFKRLSHINNLVKAPILFAIDYTKSNYLFFSNSLGNYSAQEVMEGGLEMTMPLMPNAFFKTYNEQVFPHTLSLLKAAAQLNDTEYVVSFNHRIKNTDGSYSDTYQRCKYIMSKETGFPLYCVGIGYDISYLKDNNTISLSFERIEQKTGLSKLVDKTFFYPYEEDALLTKQEKKILNCMADGLSSREIAAKLIITINTIAKHRQNMLRKTNAKNEVQLVAFALRNKII